MKNYRTYIYPAIIILTGILLRIYFFIGHIFSDDAYYSFLGYSLFRGDFAASYLGYPIFPLRVGNLVLTNLSFNIFGIGEFATIVFPFLFSIANLLLTYFLAFELTKNEKCSLIAMLIMSFFPTDIIFASMNFVDLQNVFLINLGIYLLIKAHRNQSFVFAMIAGLLFYVSFLFKENFYYYWILMIVLWIFILFKKKEYNIQILTSFLVVVFFLSIEGSIYLLLHNDLFYRLTIMQLNYQYSYYDFFPYTAQKLSGSKNYFRNLFDQVFLINARSVLLRRFYLFLPLVAFVQSIIYMKRKENLLLTFWFIGLAILMIAFTTSFTEYKPLDLKRSWYIYPLIMPMVILSASFISSFKIQIRYALISVYLAGSVIMCTHYETFFNKTENNLFKAYLKSIPEKMIYADHFTKYSVDLIRGYEKPGNSLRISGKDFNWNQLEINNLVIYSEAHIDELKLQKYEFPDFRILFSDKFQEIKSFSNFRIFEKK